MRKTRKLSVRKETLRKLDSLSSEQLARVAGGTLQLNAQVLYVGDLNMYDLGRIGGSLSCDTRCL